jgi:hypothetical protein
MLSVERGRYPKPPSAGDLHCDVGPVVALHREFHPKVPLGLGSHQRLHDARVDAMPGSEVQFF